MLMLELRLAVGRLSQMGKLAIPFSEAVSHQRLQRVDGRRLNNAFGWKPSNCADT
jgi:hypothetical protein